MKKSIQIRLLDYAHRPENISSWKHDIIEKWVYGYRDLKTKIYIWCLGRRIK